MRKHLLLFGSIYCLLMSGNILAQETSKESKLNFNVGLDVMSRYVWRGTQFGGSSPSLQPSAELGIGKLSIGAWGAYSTGGINHEQELDLYASYSFANDLFTATVTDYFFPNASDDYKYFAYNKDKTGHIFEASLSYNGSESWPISLLIATNFYGDDAKKVNDDPASSDFNQEDGIQYSTYIELGYATSINHISINTFLGANLNNPKKADAQTGYVGENGFYGSGSGIVNLGLTASKEIQITDQFSVPVSLSLITNPQAEKVFYVVGISF